MYAQEGSLVELLAERKDMGESLSLQDILSIFLQVETTRLLPEPT